MKYDVSVLFWLRKNKLNSQRLCPVYARITVNGKRAEMATGVFVQPGAWRGDRGVGNQITGKSQQAKADNARLLDLRGEIQDLYYELEREGKVIDAQTIKTRLTAPTVQSSVYTFAQLLDEYLEHERASKVLAIGSVIAMSQHRSALWKALGDIDALHTSLSEISLQAARQLQKYLLSLQYSESYQSRLIRLGKSVLSYAVELGYIAVNPWAEYRKPNTGKRKQEIIYLTEDEVAALLAAPCNYRQAKVRDRFLLQCYTGLAYDELMRLSLGHIFEQHGRKWVTIKRRKTGKSYTFPLFASAEKLLKAYNYQVPAISNSCYNKYLKELAGLAGIEKNLTTHVGRKTFATTMLNKGVDLASVSKMIGHADVKITQASYATVLNEKIARDTAHIEL